MYLIRRNAVYYVRYVDQFENRFKQFSTKCRNKKDALQILSNFQEEIKQKKKLSYISLETFKQEYLEQVKILHSRKYYTSINYTFSKLIDSVGDLPLIRLDRIKLERFLLQTFDNAKHNAWHYFRNLRAAFNYAVSRNYLEVNPLSGIKLPKIPDKINLYISEPEFNSILDKTADKQLKDLFTFAYNSGLRLGEIINLKWKAVSLTEQTMQIQSDETFSTKGNKSRLIPINSILFDILKGRFNKKVYDLQLSEKYIFHKSGIRLHPDFVSRKFKQAVLDAKLNPEYHFHLLRASFISNLAKRNVPLVAIQKLVGHTSIKITEKHYLTVQNDLLKEAMQSLENKQRKAAR